MLRAETRSKARQRQVGLRLEAAVGRNGTHDPHVWSGRAWQEGFVDLAVCGLASMYAASGWSGS